MKENQQSKEYETPQFQFVRLEVQSKVLLAVSGTPGPAPKSVGATLSGIGGW